LAFVELTKACVEKAAAIPIAIVLLRMNFTTPLMTAQERNKLRKEIATLFEHFRQALSSERHSR
jgi:hypothetical protein